VNVSFVGGTRISAELRAKTLGGAGDERSLLVVERWNIALREKDTMKSARRIFGDGTAILFCPSFLTSRGLYRMTRWLRAVRCGDGFVW
jgi:hypothetical protein